MEKLLKRPVAETLRNMSVGDVEVFPLEQTGAIRTAPRTTLIMENAKGWKWSTKCDFQNRRVSVTRTS